jgi:hypothetical protein
MSAPERAPESAIAATQAPETFADRAARVIGDPVGSAVAGLVPPAAAFGFVISAMYGLALVY